MAQRAVAAEDLIAKLHRQLARWAKFGRSLEKRAREGDQLASAIAASRPILLCNGGGARILAETCIESNQ